MAQENLLGERVRKQNQKVRRKYVECPTCEGSGEVGKMVENHSPGKIEFRTCPQCGGRGEIKWVEF